MNADDEILKRVEGLISKRLPDPTTGIPILTDRITANNSKVGIRSLEIVAGQNPDELKLVEKATMALQDRLQDIIDSQIAARTGSIVLAIGAQIRPVIHSALLELLSERREDLDRKIPRQSDKEQE